MKRTTKWGWIWTAWTAVVVASFAVLESIALRRRAFPPYSAVLCRWRGAPRTHRSRLLTMAFVAGWAWVTVHVVRYPVEGRA